MKDEWKLGNPCHWQVPAYSKRCLFLRIINIMTLITGLVYLIYRAAITFTLRCHFMMVAYQIGFFLLEIIVYSQIWLRTFELWQVERRDAVHFDEIPLDSLSSISESTEEGNHAILNTRKQPTVNIYIPCYKESLEIVQNSIEAVTKIDYPKKLIKVYLCDDGKDRMKKEMIEKINKRIESQGEDANLVYMIRPDNKHAKAGNLNNALQQTNSDLVVILDADFTAYSDLVKCLLPYFYHWNNENSMYEFDNDLAFVQTPQRYRNLSPFDNDPLDQRSVLFYDFILPARDTHNASTLVGTTNMISRKALDKVGLFPTHSITEDTALSFIFHAAKYKGYYVNKTLANGLATGTLHEFVKQRNRYAKGDFQILLSSKGPLTIRGLTIRQRICYLQMIMSRFISMTYMLFDAYLLLLLLFSVSPLLIDKPKLFLLFWGVYTGFQVMAEIVITSGRFGFLKSSAASTVLEILFRLKLVNSFFKVLFRRKCIQFKVTAKEGDAPRSPAKYEDNMEGSTVIDLEEEVKEDEEIENNTKSLKQITTELRKNLRATWTSSASLLLYAFSICWALVKTPDPEKFYDLETKYEKFSESSLLLVVIAFAYAAATIIGQLIIYYLCFSKFLLQFKQSFFLPGYKRWDQYYKSQKDGTWKVPMSPIVLYHWIKLIILIAAITAFTIYLFV